ncbi:hypothetical protein [Halomonas cupida]|uniref:DUF2125 domain-containing protein n=1 Tax=Halomonas cupida TaxID=44933 RepID=A0A1M7F084_9GAMM|nr:hypothetical protein [Halomonas cupida]GEN23334.1 hypothetical protein HCU01_12830 [Halomonas cupida]SHL97148.1 hypothetical protein SAMN05660971_01865 [Halomonas cupida]
MARLNYIAAAALGVALVPGLAQADAEQLEQDLRALAGKGGEINIGDVSDALLGGSSTAKDISITQADGTVITILSYKVDGDYENPDEVIAKGIRISDSDLDIAADSLTLEAPGSAVPDFSNLSATYNAENPLPGLSAEALVLEQKEPTLLDDDESSELRGAHIEIASVSASNISKDAIGEFSLSDLSGNAEQFAELGAATFSLPSLTFSGLVGMEDDAPQFDDLQLSDLDISADKLVMTLAGMAMDSNMEDGEYRSSLDTLTLDLAKMIELAPVDERTNLRMVSNVLTGGTGELTLDSVLDGTWQQDGDNGDLASRFELSAADAFKFNFDADLPVAIPEGVEASEYFAGLEDWTELDTLGGDVVLNLEDLGVFGRIVPVAAATQQISEDEFLAQMRTQAEGFGTLMGPQLGELLSGLVQLMAGEASNLAVNLTLPPSAEAEALSQDPLGLPDAMKMQVTVK